MSDIKIVTTPTAGNASEVQAERAGGLVPDQASAACDQVPAAAQGPAGLL